MQLKTRNKTTGEEEIALSIATSAGAGSAGAVAHLDTAGQYDMSLIKTASGTGVAADAGKVLVADPTGKISETALPSGVGSGAQSYPTSEALAAGDAVDIYLNASVATVRKADGSTTGKWADGYVKAAYASGTTATVYTTGINNQATGLTIGEKVYLSTSTPGSVQVTVPSGAGKGEQVLGVAVSATAYIFRPDNGRKLAE